MGKFTVHTTDPQEAWVLQKMKKSQMSSKRAFIGSLIQAAKDSDWSPGEAFNSTPPAVIQEDSDLEKLSGKDKYLKCVRKFLDPVLAAEKAKIEMSTVETWMKSKNFVKKVQIERRLFVSSSQCDLVDVGSGKKTGNSSAITSFLSANHPSYGATRRKSFDTVVGPLIDAIGTFSKREFEKLPGGKEALIRFSKSVVAECKGYRDALED